MEVVTESSGDALISFKQALRESEKSLAAVFEALPVGVGVIDSTGTLILANQQMRRYLPTNIIPALDDQRAWRWSAHHPDGKPVERAEYPLIRALRGESVLPGLEMLYTENEVSTIWTRVAAVPLRDGEGQVNGAFTVVTEINELKQAMDTSRESEARFRKTFEHAGIGIAITDMEGRFQLCNPAYCALLGYSLEEFRHLDFPALVHPEDRAANLVEAQRLKDEHIPFFEIENRYVHKDGRPVWVRKFASILPDATGKPAQFIALVTDITEQKRAAEELRRNRDALLSREEQLEDLTAKLLTAHEEERRRIARELHDDFSQRVAALVLDLQALEQRPADLPEPGPQALEPIRRQLERLSDDIHNLAYDLHPLLLNHAGLQPAIEDHIHEVSQRTGLRIVLKAKRVPEAIPPDRATCLFRVFQESLQNVVKHAHATEVLVTLSGTPHDIGLSVTDNGTGFTATDKSAHQRGLGLTSMQERVRLLKGFLRVHSRPADGTKVCAWIPLREGDHDASSRLDGG